MGSLKKRRKAKINKHKRRKRMKAKFRAFFATLGINMAFDNAKCGTDPEVTWIGVKFNISAWEAMLEIPASKLHELAKISRDMLSHNVIAVKSLRSLAGKATNISTLVYLWMPSLNQNWVAMTAHETHQSHTPRNCVWLKQVLLRTALRKSTASKLFA